jgi:tRNA threonylcarbamoyladenosine biosynthesis protein TsaE
VIEGNPRRVLLSESPQQTEAFGRALGAAVRRGDVLALDGDLGAGKTVLVRGLAAGAGADPAAVRSPTFVLHHVHRGRVRLHHLDFYRLGRGASLDALDLDTLAGDGAVAVEWAEYAPSLQRFAPTHLRIEVLDRSRRRIEVRDAPDHLAAAVASLPDAGW